MLPQSTSIVHCCKHPFNRGVRRYWSRFTPKHPVVCSLKDAIKELTGGKGVDVVYDPVGGDYAEPAIRGMAWNGRYLVIGFASGPIPKIALNLTLLKGCSLVGVFWGRFSMEEPQVNLQNIEALWALFAGGKISPVVTDVFPLEQYAAAFNCMMERRARGKVILTM